MVMEEIYYIEVEGLDENVMLFQWRHLRNGRVGLNIRVCKMIFYFLVRTIQENDKSHGREYRNDIRYHHGFPVDSSFEIMTSCGSKLSIQKPRDVACR
jgi:hypothetical protein